MTMPDGSVPFFSTETPIIFALAVNDVGRGIAATTEIPGVTFFAPSPSRNGTPALASAFAPHPKSTPATRLYQ